MMDICACSHSKGFHPYFNKCSQCDCAKYRQVEDLPVAVPDPGEQDRKDRALILWREWWESRKGDPSLDWVCEAEYPLRPSPMRAHDPACLYLKVAALLNENPQ